MSTPDRRQTLERERRWSRPAGISAILGAIGIQAGLFVGGAALSGDSTAERLLEASTGDADGQLLAGVVISAVGFLALVPPLTLLFLAARDRSERMTRQLVVLAMIGAALIAAGLVLNNSSYLKAADDFAASEATREEAPATPSGSSGEEGGAGAQKPANTEKQAAEGSGQRETTVEPTTTETKAASDSGSSQDDAEQRADDALADAPGATAAALLVRGGALVLSLGLFYTSLWAMRAGLLSRFWGSLGMASAVVLSLFFLYFFALVWFLAIGVLLVGVWPGGRPPAWETGVAVPWRKPGGGGEGPDDSVEGSGREIPGAGPSASEEGSGSPGALGAGDDVGAERNGTDGDGPGEPPQKRKRRR